MRARGITVFLAIVSVILIGCCVWIRMGEDRSGPAISYPENAGITYDAGTDDDSVLLADVTAVDARDGDVSDTLRIGEIQTTADGTQAVVLYTAKDHSNNVSRRSRVVSYRDSGADSAAEAAENSGDTAAAGTESAAQGTDQTASQASATDAAVSENPEEAAARANETGIAALPAGAPAVRLTQYIVTVNAGSEFDRYSYVASITDDTDSQESLMQNLQVNGELDMNTPGTYVLHYFVIDSAGSQSNTAVLTVNVV